MNGDDDRGEPHSAVCYGPGADAAYMGYASRDEIVEFLNALLEAERAGARVCLRIALEATEPAVEALATSIHRDEAHWCAMLLNALKRIEGVPSPRVGAFYEKAMAISDVSSRLAFLNKGQDWVVRKLREMLPKVKDDALYRDLDQMLKAHETNIEWVANSGLAKSN